MYDEVLGFPSFHSLGDDLVEIRDFNLGSFKAVRSGRKPFFESLDGSPSFASVVLAEVVCKHS